MSPRTASAHRSASASSPYPRRNAGQPKSTRQQFSACGACRMRRVRCDLKDLPPTITSNGPQQSSCSNCKERNIKCVDEFAEVKAVKLLRRGRRLQQVEAVYGKVTSDLAIPQNPSTPAPKLSPIPQLKPDFLNSTFFRRFCVQRPIIEPTEFTSRYLDHANGTAPLNIEGQMLAMLLVIWAASFGINEYGVEIDDQELAPNSPTSPKFACDSDDELSDPKQRVWTLRTESMTREILSLVDTHGILRRPSWDGVRVLLLLLPLTEGVQSSVERRTTYEATLSQIHALCHFTSTSSVNSGQGPLCDALVRARIFWYAYVHEGITIGLRGGRLFFNEDDLTVFQNTLPPHYNGTVSPSSPSTPESSLSSPTCGSPTTPEIGHSRASLAYMFAKHYLSLTLAVSKVSRAVHANLTGPRARQCTEDGVLVREDEMINIWDNLARCWDDFEGLRREAGGTVGGGLIRGEDIERFVSGWQVFIFQCLNVIREALKHRVEVQTSSSSHNGRVTPSNRAVAVNLHAYAVRRCRVFLPRVIDILKRHLAFSSSGFFAHDTGLIRDGCFFAGMLLTQSDLEGDAGVDIKCSDGTRWDTDLEEGVDVCLRALGQISWVYANSHEQIKSLRAHWEARIHRDNECLQNDSRDFVGRQSSPSQYPPSQDHSPYTVDKTPLPRSSSSLTLPRPLSLISAGGQVRPHLPPLSMSFPRGEGGPDTALTDDGNGSWSAYTPPTTSGSMASTIATQRSISPASPPPPLRSMQHTLPPPKTEETCYSIQDLDPFSFSVDNTTNGPNMAVPGLGVSNTWSPYSHNQPASQGNGHGYLDPRVIYSGSDAVLGRSSEDGCPHFGSDCQGYFH
ncbi:hypothetical protein V8B97DRAFT_1868574 [Scleroderma yunnanense]